MDFLKENFLSYKQNYRLDNCKQKKVQKLLAVLNEVVYRIPLKTNFKGKYCLSFQYNFKFIVSYFQLKYNSDLSFAYGGWGKGYIFQLKFLLFIVNPWLSTKIN